MRPATKGFIAMTAVYAVGAAVVVLCFILMALWFGETFR